MSKAWHRLGRFFPLLCLLPLAMTIPTDVSRRNLTQSTLQPSSLPLGRIVVNAGNFVVRYTECGTISQPRVQLDPALSSS